MRNTAFALLVSLLAVTHHANSQLFSRVRISGGVNAANESWTYSLGNKVSTTDRWGIAAGLSTSVIRLSVVEVRIGLEYIQKGMTQRIPITSASDPEGITGRYKTIGPRIDYVSIPLLVEFGLPLAFVTPHLFAGPRMDFLVARRPNLFGIIVDQFRSSEFGASAGIGVEVPSILPVDLVFDFRYDATFQDAFSSDFLTVRNRSFTIQLGVQF